MILLFIENEVLPKFIKDCLKIVHIYFNPIVQYIQGGQDPNLKFQMAITQKLSISDPTFVKPKYFWQWNVYLKNCKQTADKNVNKCSNARIILALPMMGQKCLVSEL